MNRKLQTVALREFFGDSKKLSLKTRMLIYLLAILEISIIVGVVIIKQIMDN